MNSPLAHLLVRWLVLALGVVIATHLIPVLFTLPFIIVTMGLGIVVINAILFLFVGRLVDGFTVTGFWPAVGGSLVLSATNFVVSAVTRSTAARRGGRPPGPPRSGGDVIDI